MGKLPDHCDEARLHEYFERFGALTDVYMPKEYHSGRSQGFAFVTFASEAGLFAALKVSPHTLDGVALKVSINPYQGKLRVDFVLTLAISQEAPLLIAVPFVVLSILQVAAAVPREVLPMSAPEAGEARDASGLYCIPAADCSSILVGDIGTLLACAFCVGFLTSS